MFSAIPLTPIFLNPDDLQDSEHGASVDINTFDCMDGHNVHIINDYYSNFNESNYSDNYGACNYRQDDDLNTCGYAGSDDIHNYQSLNSDITVHHKHKHYLVQSGYDDSGSSDDDDYYQSPEIDYQESTCDYDGDCDYGDYDGGDNDCY